MTDLGFTHIALEVSDMARSLDFYERFAALSVVHRRPRTDHSQEVVWLADGLRPFVLVLIETDRVSTPLKPMAHLGIAVESTAEVERLADLAREAGILSREPEDSGPPVGYWALLSDPDGHTLEIAFGQDVSGATAI